MALYAVACEAKNIVDQKEQDLTMLKKTLSSITDDDVKTAIDGVNYLMNALANINNDLKTMRIINVNTGADPINECVHLSVDAQLGHSQLHFGSTFSREGAQQIMDGLNMAILAIQPGKQVSLQEGNA